MMSYKVFSISVSLWCFTWNLRQQSYILVFVNGWDSIIIITVIKTIKPVVQLCPGKKGLFRSLTRFTGKHLCQSRFFNKVAGLSPREHTARKVSKYEVLSGLYFHVFGLNTETYGVNLRIQSKYRKIQTRKNSVFEHLSCSDKVKKSTVQYFRKKLHHRCLTWS